MVLRGILLLLVVLVALLVLLAIVLLLLVGILAVVLTIFPAIFTTIFVTIVLAVVLLAMVVVPVLARRILSVSLRLRRVRVVFATTAILLRRRVMRGAVALTGISVRHVAHVEDNWN